MNAGIGASLTAVLDEIVAINTVIPVDSTEGVAPELTLHFLALPGRNRSRGERRVPLKTDRITVTVRRVNVPGQIVSPVNLNRVWIGIAVVNSHTTVHYFRTFLRIGIVAATEDPQ